MLNVWVFESICKCSKPENRVWSYNMHSTKVYIAQTLSGRHIMVYVTKKHLLSSHILLCILISIDIFFILKIIHKIRNYATIMQNFFLEFALYRKQSLILDCAMHE